jgi:hypothetical protein
VEKQDWKLPALHQSRLSSPWVDRKHHRKTGLGNPQWRNAEAQEAILRFLPDTREQLSEALYLVLSSRSIRASLKKRATCGETVESIRNRQPLK